MSRLLELPFANYSWSSQIHPGGGPPPITDRDRPLQYPYRYFPTVKPEIEELVRSAAGSELWQVFDQDAAKRWLSAPDPSHHQMMGLINLYGVARSIESF
jgi:hypothetical protein